MKDSTKNNGQEGSLEDTKPEQSLDMTIIEAQNPTEPFIRASKRCGVGAIRERNEDSCLIFTAENGGHVPFQPFGLYIVADGMGGHEDGHLASRVASRTAAAYILKEIYLPFLQGQLSIDQAEILGVMEEAGQKAHLAIGENKPKTNGGTTFTAVLILNQTLYIAHVGDSRAYWLVDGKFEAVTIDHSLVQRLQDTGQLTEQEAERYQYRNVLLRALGQEDALVVDTYQRELPTSGKLLLCSDGLCGFVSDQSLEFYMSQSNPTQHIADKLYDTAMATGGHDNITAVVVEFSL